MATCELSRRRFIPARRTTFNLIFPCNIHYDLNLLTRIVPGTHDFSTAGDRTRSSIDFGPVSLPPIVFRVPTRLRGVIDVSTRVEACARLLDRDGPTHVRYTCQSQSVAPSFFFFSFFGVGLSRGNCTCVIHQSLRFRRVGCHGLASDSRVFDPRGCRKPLISALFHSTTHDHATLESAIVETYQRGERPRHMGKLLHSVRLSGFQPMGMLDVSDMMSDGSRTALGDYG